MRAQVALLLLVVTVAGCLGAPSPGNVTAPDNNTTAPLPGGVDRYDGTGNDTPHDTSPTRRLANVTRWTNLTGHGGAEPTMGITDSGAIFATADDTMIRSTDEAGSWEVVYEIGGADDDAGDVWESYDPLMDVDHSTDTVYMDPMFPPLACSELSWSTDDGGSWTTNPAVCHPPPMDHQKLFVGPPSPDAPPAAGVAHGSVLYQCYNQGLDTACATSYDGGLTWANWQVVMDVQRHGCGGINGFGEVGPDGVAAVPVSSGCDALHLAVTADSGVTWDVVEVPGDMGGRGFDPEVDFGANGTMYAMWPGDDHAMYLARSPDQGRSWDGPWKLDPPGVTSTIFPTIRVGAGGQGSFAFYGTDDTAKSPDDAGGNVNWNLYVVTTGDVTAANMTFTSWQMTTDDDPVQVGRICMGGIGCGEKRNLLEFIDSAIHPDGDLYVVYTDGCVGECAKDPSSDTSTSSRIGMARLSGLGFERKSF